MIQAIIKITPAKHICVVNDFLQDNKNYKLIIYFEFKITSDIYMKLHNEYW